jgi:hypothetical protein
VSRDGLPPDEGALFLEATEDYMIEHKTSMMIERRGGMVQANIVGAVEPRSHGCGHGRPEHSAEDTGGFAHVDTAIDDDGLMYTLYDQERVTAERALFASWEARMIELRASIGNHLGGCDKASSVDIASVAATVGASTEEVLMVLRALALEAS